jgi:glycosyltransferase involved in cell wall biosynthesis
MPRVSVLLTCYNHLQHLPDALGAVFAQTFTDYEVLALDDGSSDGTREYLQAQGATVFPMFNETNLGTYATLNVGLDRASGEFVAILNDDDVWAPTKLEQQVAALDARPNCALCHTSGWFIDDQGERIPGEPMGFPFPKSGTGNLLPILVERNQMITSAVLARTQVLRELGGFDPSFFGFGDWQMWLRVARHHGIAFVDEPLTLYRVHPGNASKAATVMEQESLRIREWITQWEAEELDPSSLRAFATNWRCIGGSREILGDRLGARTAFAHAFRLTRDPKALYRLVRSYLP